MLGNFDTSLFYLCFDLLHSIAMYVSYIYVLCYTFYLLMIYYILIDLGKLSLLSVILCSYYCDLTQQKCLSRNLYLWQEYHLIVQEL